MDDIGLAYRYLDGDLDQPQVQTEYERIQVDHDNETVHFPFSPAGADGGDQLVMYLEDHDDAEYLRPFEDYDDPQAELERRLPELQTVMDETTALYDTVVQTFLEDVPENYWTKPSSATGWYHPPDERQMHGQWIHTKRTLQQIKTLQRTARHLENEYGLEEQENDVLGAATALHDIAKYGEDGEHGHVTDDHAEDASTLLDDSLPDAITTAIRHHDGPWGEKDPATIPDLYTHLGDLTASSIDNTSLLYRPKPALKFIDLADQLTEIEPATAFYTVTFEPRP